MDMLSFVLAMGGFYIVLPIVAVIFAAMLMKLFFMILLWW